MIEEKRIKMIEEERIKLIEEERIKMIDQERVDQEIMDKEEELRFVKLEIPIHLANIKLKFGALIEVKILDSPSPLVF